MDLRDYTTYADVRAALGVSAKEISDEILALPLYEDSLKNELDELGTDFLADYDALLVATTLTRPEEKLLRVGRLFCSYTVAHQCTVALPLFSPREVSDGKASFSRYNDNPYAATTKDVKSRYSQYRAAVIAAYESVKSATSVTATPLYVVISTPTSNPITG
jgi:hypothetical protein